jgi:hypothetical protein
MGADPIERETTTTDITRDHGCNTFLPQPNWTQDITLVVPCGFVEK